MRSRRLLPNISGRSTFGSTATLTQIRDVIWVPFIIPDVREGCHVDDAVGASKSLGAQRLSEGDSLVSGS